MISCAFAMIVRPMGRLHISVPALSVCSCAVISSDLMFMLNRLLLFQCTVCSSLSGEVIEEVIVM